MERYCVVLHKAYKELGRSKPMEFKEALKMVQIINKNNPNHNANAENAYVETAASVKHLPVIL